MEIITRRKNVATTIPFPLIDAADGRAWFTGTVWGSLTNTSKLATYDDGTPDQVLTITGTPIESGTITGGWLLTLTQAQMNHDIIFIKLNADEIDPQGILINTTVLKVDLDEDVTRNSGKLLGKIIGDKAVTPDGTDRDYVHGKAGVVGVGTPALEETIDEDGNVEVTGP